MSNLMKSINLDKSKTLDELQARETIYAETYNNQIAYNQWFKPLKAASKKL